eukprot:TRINITY_DN9360_c2_g1_i1.p1 TRINITY_DN9360_c2_g1~~TRINITY_DN9360_c2_g1_i1.p1  ORF type:complete len:185 (-),score=57.89 TRINITY_DN9360_c2_g1_i1:81-635(-)
MSYLKNLARRFKTTSPQEREQITKVLKDSKHYNDLKAQDKVIEDFMSGLTFKGESVPEINWEAYKERVNPQVVDYLQLLTQKTQEKSKKLAEEYIQGVEKNSWAPYLEELGKWEQGLGDFESKIQADLQKDKEVLVKLDNFKKNAHKVTVDDVLKAYPELVDELIDDIMHDRWDGEKHVEAAHH